MTMVENENQDELDQFMRGFDSLAKFFALRLEEMRLSPAVLVFAGALPFASSSLAACCALTPLSAAFMPCRAVRPMDSKAARPRGAQDEYPGQTDFAVLKPARAPADAAARARQFQPRFPERQEGLRAQPAQKETGPAAIGEPSGVRSNSGSSMNILVAIIQRPIPDRYLNDVCTLILFSFQMNQGKAHYFLAVYSTGYFLNQGKERENTPHETAIIISRRREIS